MTKCSANAYCFVSIKILNSERVVTIKCFYKFKNFFELCTKFEHEGCSIFFQCLYNETLLGVLDWAFLVIFIDNRGDFDSF